MRLIKGGKDDQGEPLRGLAAILAPPESIDASTFGLWKATVLADAGPPTMEQIQAAFNKARRVAHEFYGGSHLHVVDGGEG